jgi:hypothetical protein
MNCGDEARPETAIGASTPQLITGDDARLVAPVVTTGDWVLSGFGVWIAVVLRAWGTEGAI